MIKKIIYPEKSELLAEETGIHFGDGCMIIRIDKWGRHYRYSYAAHTYDDSSYINYFKSIIKNLYGLTPTYEKSHKNQYDLIYESKNLVNFKLSLGISLSPKDDLRIPEWILNNKEFSHSFLRGIFDTDGSLMFKRKNGNSHNYPYIYLSLKNKLLMKQIHLLLFKLGIKSSLSEHKQKRNFKNHICWDIGISGSKNLNNFINNIGFNNKKHFTKYLIWKRFGFCPINTTLQQRENILNRNLSITTLIKMSERGFEPPITASLTKVDMRVTPC